MVNDKCVLDNIVFMILSELIFVFFTKSSLRYLEYYLKVKEFLFKYFRPYCLNTYSKYDFAVTLECIFGIQIKSMLNIFFTLPCSTLVVEL